MNGDGRLKQLELGSEMGRSLDWTWRRPVPCVARVFLLLAQFVFVPFAELVRPVVDAKLAGPGGEAVGVLQLGTEIVCGLNPVGA